MTADTAPLTNAPPPPSWRDSVLISAAGWYGTFAIIGAYALLSAKLLDQGFTYQLLNLSGGIGIVLVSAAKRAYQPMVLNIVWSVIGAASLVRLLF